MSTLTKHRIVGDFKIEQKNAQKRTFAGALSTSHLDLGDGFRRDIVWPKAFDEWIANEVKGASDPYVPLLDSHDGWSIMNVYGHLLSAEERLTGKVLTYELAKGGTIEVPEMFLDTEWQIIDGVDGDRVLDRLRPGSVRKMSMGYQRLQSDEVELAAGPARNLRKLAVEEGSLVVFPMNPSADVYLDSVKSRLASMNRDALSDDDRKLLRMLASQIGALLRPTDPAAPEKAAPQDEPAALAPDDPRRLEAEELLRDLEIRSLVRNP